MSGVQKPPMVAIRELTGDLACELNRLAGDGVQNALDRLMLNDAINNAMASAAEVVKYAEDADKVVKNAQREHC